MKLDLNLLFAWFIAPALAITLVLYFGQAYPYWIKVLAVGGVGGLIVLVFRGVRHMLGRFLRRELDARHGQ